MVSARDGMASALVVGLFWSGLILVLAQGPAGGYEVSILTRGVLVGWLLDLAALVTASVFLALERGSPGALRLGLLLHGFLAALVLLGLPLLRGYELYGGSDPMIHLGVARDLLDTGSINPDNVYPALHVLEAMVTLGTGEDLFRATAQLRLVTNLVFVLGTLALVRAVVTPRPRLGRYLLVALLPVYGASGIALYPNELVFMLSPVIVYLLVRRLQSTETSVNVAIILFLVGLPFLYPPAVLIFLFGWVFASVAHRVASRGPFHGLPLQPRPTGNLVMLGCLIFIGWVSSFAVFGATVHNVIFAIGGGFYANPQIIRASTVFRNVRGLDLVLFFAKAYGNQAVLLLAAVIGLTSRVSLPAVRTRLRFMALLLVGMEMASAAIFATSFFQTPGRFLNLNLGTILLLPMAAVAAVPPGRGRVRGRALPVLLLTLALVLGAGTVYDTPYVLKPNPQVGLADVASATTLQAMLPPRDPLLTVGVPPAIFVASTGYRDTLHTSFYSVGYDPAQRGLPSHFSVDGEVARDCRPNGELVFLVGARNRAALDDPTLARGGIWSPETYRPDISPGDLAQLDFHPRVSLVYSTSSLDAYILPCPGGGGS